MMSILGILDVLRGTPLLYAPSGVRLTDSTQFHFCSFAAELVPHKNPPTKTFAANDSNGREEERERPAAPPAAEYVLVFLCSLCGLRTTLAKSVICAMVMAFHGTFCGDATQRHSLLVSLIRSFPSRGERETCSSNYCCCASVVLNSIYFWIS